MGTPGIRDQASAQEAGPVSDQVDISSTQKLRQLHQAAMSVPEVRLEKVVELRGQIDDGSYHVETEKLARKVVDEALADLLQSKRQARI